jgi:hypothetical protein
VRARTIDVDTTSVGILEFDIDDAERTRCTNTAAVRPPPSSTSGTLRPRRLASDLLARRRDLVDIDGLLHSERQTRSPVCCLA